jgi:hypothetical protein
VRSHRLMKPAPGYLFRERVLLGLTSVYRALGGGWQIRNDEQFVDVATARQMRARTDWGVLLPPPEQPQPPAPGLPGPGNIGSTVRPPEW